VVVVVGEGTPGCVDGAAGTGSGAIVAVDVGDADVVPGVIVPLVSLTVAVVADSVSVSAGAGVSVRAHAASTSRAAISSRFSSIGRIPPSAMSSMNPAE
jgi:hypothetical protein